MVFYYPKKSIFILALFSSLLCFGVYPAVAQFSSYPGFCSFYATNITPKNNSDVSGTIKINFTINAADNFDCQYYNRKDCNYSMRGGFADKTYTNTTGSFDTNIMETGTYRASFSCKLYRYPDTTRFTSVSGYTNLKITRDTAPPAVSITSLYEGQQVYDEIVIKATASDTATGNSPITGVHFYAGNTDLGVDTTSPYEARFNTAGLPNGTLRIVAHATDASGNAASAVVNLNVKNHESAPTVQILELQPNQLVKGNITLRINASDDENIRIVRFYIDGNEITSAVAPPYDIVINTAQYPNGIHQIGAIAEDFAGLLGSAAIDLNFENFDRKPPFVQFAAPITGQVTSGQMVVHLQADDESGIRAAQLYLNRDLYADFVPNNYQTTIDTTRVPDGIYNLTAIVSDNANNVAFQTIVVIIRNGDSLEPAVAIIHPQESSVVSGLIPLVANATDNVAVDGVEFYVDDILLGESKVSPYQWRLDTSLLQDGAHTITAIAYDFTGYQGRHTVRIVVNNSNTMNASAVPLAARVLPSLIYGDDGQLSPETAPLTNQAPELGFTPGDAPVESVPQLSSLRSIVEVIDLGLNSLQKPQAAESVSKRNPEHAKAIKAKLTLATKTMKKIKAPQGEEKKHSKAKVKFDKFKSLTKSLLKTNADGFKKSQSKSKKAAKSLISSLN